MLWTPNANRELFDENIGGIVNLLQAAVAAGRPLRRFFQISSDEVYPSLHRYLPNVDLRGACNHNSTIIASRSGSGSHSNSSQKAALDRLPLVNSAMICRTTQLW